MVRTCKTCKEDKEISEFSIHTRKGNKIYYRAECKVCFRSTYGTRYREKDKTRARAYYDKNRDDVRQKARAKYQENREQEIARTRKYKDDNKEETKKYREEYYKKNREKLISQQIKRAKIRRKIDPAFKLRDNLSKHINSALKKRGSSKMGDSVFRHLDYTADDLKRHLEAQFEHWMSWSNYGEYNQKTWDDEDQSTWKWNIDHIVPQSKFSFLSMDESGFKECWDLGNLRPLSAKANLQKGNR